LQTLDAPQIGEYAKEKAADQAAEVDATEHHGIGTVAPFGNGMRGNPGQGENVERFETHAIGQSAQGHPQVDMGRVQRPIGHDRHRAGQGQNRHPITKRTRKAGEEIDEANAKGDPTHHISCKENGFHGQLSRFHLNRQVVGEKNVVEQTKKHAQGKGDKGLEREIQLRRWRRLVVFFGSRFEADAATGPLSGCHGDQKDQQGSVVADALLQQAGKDGSEGKTQEIGHADHGKPLELPGPRQN